MAFGGDIASNKEPEPITAHANHQCADIPELRQKFGRGGGRGGISKHQDRRRNRVDNETVHTKKVSDAPPQVTEFSGCQSFRRRFERKRQFFAAADLPRTAAVRGRSDRKSTRLNS